MDANGDIYYGNNGREKFRSVHRPVAPHATVAFRSAGNEWRPEMSNYQHEKGTSSCQSFSNDSDRRERSDGDGSDRDDSDRRERNYFEMATIDDCHDPSSRWPHSDGRFFTNSEEQNSSHTFYFNLPLPDMPPFLQITHFCVKGRTWLSIEEQINSVLSARSSSDFAFEHSKAEFLWLCNFSSLNHCSFQIRAYVDMTGENVVIEMQRLSGEASFFSEIYHSMRMELLLDVQPVPSGNRLLLQQRTIPSASPNINNDSTPSNISNAKNNNSNITDNATSDMVEDDLDSDINFLLIPVLEMLKNDDYTDMQSEALKMICELSATREDIKDDERDSSGNTSSGFYAGESSRKQMREMGYIPILTEIVCKCFKINNENKDNLIHVKSPHTGIRAMTALLNIIENQNISDFLPINEKSTEFYYVISFLSEYGLPNQVQSASLQNKCKQILLKRL